MSMMESVSYLKGLAEGLGIDDSTKEGKLLSAIVDVLDDMAAEIADIEETADEQAELLDIIDEDLGSLEEDFYGDGEEDDECGCDDDLYEVVDTLGDKLFAHNGQTQNSIFSLKGKAVAASWGERLNLVAARNDNPVAR